MSLGKMFFTTRTPSVPDVFVSGRNEEPYVRKHRQEMKIIYTVIVLVCAGYIFCLWDIVFNAYKYDAREIHVYKYQRTN